MLQFQGKAERAGHARHSSAFTVFLFRFGTLPSLVPFWLETGRSAEEEEDEGGQEANRGVGRGEEKEKKIIAVRASLRRSLRAIDLPSCFWFRSSSSRLKRTKAYRWVHFAEHVQFVERGEHDEH